MAICLLVIASTFAQNAEVSFDRILDPRRRVAVLLASGGMIAAIAIVDWQTPPYVSLGFLYLFPVALAAGVLPRGALVVLGLLCAGLSEVFSSLGSSGRPARLTIEALAFAGCGLFVRELVQSRRLTLESGARFQAVLRTSPAAIVVLNDRGTIELANQAAAELTGAADGNLIGQAITKFVPALENAIPCDGRPLLRASMECRVVRASGEASAAEVWFSTYLHKGSAKLAAIVVEVQEAEAGAETRNQERPELNSRQIAVLRALFAGLSNSGIAAQLNMTPSAVKNTLQQLFSKAGVNNRAQLVRIALEQYRDLL